MRSKLTLFAAACVASLAMSTSASAATILQFAQTSSIDTVVATVAGSTTTLSTTSATFPGSIPIRITQEGNVTPPGGSLAAFETFLPALGSTVAGSGPPPLQNGFTGTIIFSTGPNGTGGNILTVMITNGRMTANGNAGGFEASNGTTNGGLPVTVTLTSSDPNIAPLLVPSGGPATGAVALALINITPSQTGAGFTSFTAQNAGNVSTLINPIPEPASVVSAGTALLVGLGCFGWSRRKSSKA